MPACPSDEREAPPTDRPIGAAAFSEAQMAEDAWEAEDASDGQSDSGEVHQGTDAQTAALLAEQIAEAEDSVT
jgi:hypothetical protein